MKYILKNKNQTPSGFALIATISVMVLLVMIALAMLSLSTIELRASQNGRAMAEAQANARMALMLAIGKLQLHAGSDTRITAPADIIDEYMPSLTGVWRSWEGTNHTLTGSMTGRPTVPEERGGDVSHLSFKGSLQALRQWEPHLNHAKISKQERFRILSALYDAIADNEVPLRPGRQEPRCVKRRPKSYQLLTAPRHQMKEIPHRSNYKANKA
jgi:hypothetical protein